MTVTAYNLFFREIYNLYYGNKPIVDTKGGKIMDTFAWRIEMETMMFIDRLKSIMENF